MALSEVGEPPSSPPLIPSLALPHIRKRSSLQDLRTFDISSDGIFSSDDIEPGIENYSTKRRKRFHKGSWWSASEHQRIGPSAGTRRFKRNMDSGVEMNSDNSSEAFSDPPPASDEVNEADAVDNSWSPPARPEKLIAAEEFIEECITEGEDTIDMAGFLLGDDCMPDLEPLNALVSHHRFRRPARDQYGVHGPTSDDSDDSDRYADFTPKLRVFLAANLLTRLSCEIWELEHLKLLTIRNNDISYLSPNVVKAMGIEELNISSNALQYLPWEMLNTAFRERLKFLHAKPNPFVNPYCLPQLPSADGDTDVPNTISGRIQAVLRSRRAPPPPPAQHLTDSLDDLLYRPIPSRDNSIFIGSSGRLQQPYRAELLTFSEDSQIGIHLGRRPTVEELTQDNLVVRHDPSRVPTLFELTLRQIKRSKGLAQVAAETLASNPADDGPRIALIRPILPYLIFQDEVVGDKDCSVCGSTYITAFASWFEFWLWRDRNGPWYPEIELERREAHAHGDEPAVRQEIFAEPIRRRARMPRAYRGETDSGYDQPFVMHPDGDRVPPDMYPFLREVCSSQCAIEATAEPVE